jgi:sorbitol-specific phosphotransferase system component IIC
MLSDSCFSLTEQHKNVISNSILNQYSILNSSLNSDISDSYYKRVLIDFVDEYRAEKVADKQREKWLLKIAVLLLISIILFGTLAFHYYFGEPWIRSFYIAILIITNLNVDIKPQNSSQEIFIAIYSFIAAVVFVGVVSYAIQAYID